MWRTKEKTDEVEAASVNMVFVLPIEFKAPIDEDVEKDVAQLSLIQCKQHLTN